MLENNSKRKGEKVDNILFEKDLTDFNKNNDIYPIRSFLFLDYLIEHIKANAEKVDISYNDGFIWRNESIPVEELMLTEESFTIGSYSFHHPMVKKQKLLKQANLVWDDVDRSSFVLNIRKFNPVMTLKIKFKHNN